MNDIKLEERTPWRDLEDVNTGGFDLGNIARFTSRPFLTLIKIYAISVICGRFFYLRLEFLAHKTGGISDYQNPAGPVFALLFAVKPGNEFVD